MSLIGKEIADFSVMSYRDNRFEKIAKKDLLGRWSLLFFYPADFSFVCPTELEDLQEHYDDFKGEGCEIYSVSTDSHFVHKAWHDSSEKVGKVTYPMLADPAHRLSLDFDVLSDDDGMSERAVFILDPKGKIVSCAINSGGVGRNATELLRILRACKFVDEHGDRVCPAGWQKGDDTLAPSLDLVGSL